MAVSGDQRVTLLQGDFIEYGPVAASVPIGLREAVEVAYRPGGRPRGCDVLGVLPNSRYEDDRF